MPMHPMQSPLPGAKEWQLLTGHQSGQVKLWAVPHGCPLHPLAVIGAPASSPVTSLVVLYEQQLLCFAHADGCLALHTSPQKRSQAPAVQAQDGQLTHSLQYTVYQAHQRGLSLCIKCVVGLVSVGTSGTILMWSGDQLASLVQQCGLQLHDRYCHCDSNMHLLHAQKCQVLQATARYKVAI